MCRRGFGALRVLAVVFCLEGEVGCEAGAHDNDIIMLKAAIVPKIIKERKKSFITAMRL